MAFKKGMIAWNKNKISKNCIYCNCLYKIPLCRKNTTRFCSMSCRHKFEKGKPNLKRRRRKFVECKICKNLFEIQNWKNRKYCSRECMFNDKKWMEKVMETKKRDNTLITSSTFKKGHKAITYVHSEESKKKLSLSRKKENNPNWHNGTSFEPYSTDWTPKLRRMIRERDNYTCQKCGAKQEDYVFSVHHIDRNKKNCNPKNLITLCKRCHSVSHGVR